jgi:hypothetical protein
MGMTGMTSIYPVMGLYSIIYGTLFCFLEKHKGEGNPNGAGSATASISSMAKYLLNPFTLPHF